MMELVCSTAGGEEGGKGWRDFFSGALTAGREGSVSVVHFNLCVLPPLSVTLKENSPEYETLPVSKL